MAKITIHVPDDVHEQMEREVTRRGTTRSGLWVEAAQKVLEAGETRSRFFHQLADAMQNEDFRHWQAESRAEHRGRPQLPAFEADNIDPPDDIRC